MCLVAYFAGGGYRNEGGQRGRLSENEPQKPARRLAPHGTAATPKWEVRSSKSLIIVIDI